VATNPIALPVRARAELQRDAEAAAWSQLRSLLRKGDQIRLRQVLAIESGEPAAEIVRYARTRAI